MRGHDDGAARIALSAREVQTGLRFEPESKSSSGRTIEDLRGVASDFSTKSVDGGGLPSSCVDLAPIT